MVFDGLVLHYPSMVFILQKSVKESVVCIKMCIKIDQLLNLQQRLTSYADRAISTKKYMTLFNS